MEGLELDGLEAKLDHVAIAGHRIRELLVLYRDVLGGQYVGGGDKGGFPFRVLQLAYPNGGKIELMEPHEGTTFFDSFFRRCPQGGLHHVTFLVKDIVAAMATLEARGYELILPDLESPRWREVFVHPKSANGVLVQIASQDVKVEAVALEDLLAGRAPGGNGRPSL